MSKNITTSYSVGHTTQSCRFEAPPHDQTIAQGRNHNHGSPQCFPLLPSNPRAHHTPAKTTQNVEDLTKGIKMHMIDCNSTKDKHQTVRYKI